MKKLLVVILAATLATIMISTTSLASETSDFREAAGLLIEEMHAAVESNDGGSAAYAFAESVNWIENRYNEFHFYSDSGVSNTEAGATQWSSIKLASVTYAVAQSPGEMTYTVSLENADAGYTYSYSVSIKDTGACIENAVLHYQDGSVIHLGEIGIVF